MMVPWHVLANERVIYKMLPTVNELMIASICATTAAFCAEPL